MPAMPLVYQPVSVQCAGWEWRLGMSVGAAGREAGRTVSVSETGLR